jgi:hypothetical protein
MDSTMKSNLSVGPPLDLVVYEANRFETDKLVCIDMANPYYRMLHSSWGQKLREVFDSGYDDIAKILGKSEAACRQIVSRASKRVRAEQPRVEVSPEAKEKMLAGFMQAVPRTSQGDYVAFALSATDSSGACSSHVGLIGGRQQIDAEEHEESVHARRPSKDRSRARLAPGNSKPHSNQ